MNMKIQSLAVIFIIIILPITIILSEYIGNQAKTLHLQTSYDTKLNNATYDALKAFQLNTVNSGTSDLSNSKIRDIEASANTFFNSVASNFNLAGYNQEILSSYVPALVYTMYDGYYIYSNYTNTLDDRNQNQDENGQNLGSDADLLENNPNATSRNEQRLSGLKPYIYYSCRYVRGASDDFVITYSLDNYITIQGVIKGKWVFDSGYLLNDISINSNNSVTYKGVTFNTNETLSEYIWDPEANAIRDVHYKKINGVKYYYETDGSCFTLLNGEKLKMQDTIDLGNSTTAAHQYYQKGKEFTDKVLGSEYNLATLTTSHAVDENGISLADKLGGENIRIFTDNRNQIEEPNSNFNQHRLAVIRYSIEKNLSIAIANYNNYATGPTNFQMPKLKEDEWEKIINNVSIISFLQGLSIGGKIYNGYSIITNNKNEEVVNEDSIYILTNDNIYHRANANDIDNANNPTGVLNIDFERKSYVTTDGIKYVIPKRRKQTNRRK